MFEILVPKFVIRWKLDLSNQSESENELAGRITTALIRGSVNYKHKHPRPISSEKPIILWLSKEKNTIDSWAILISNYVDDDEIYLFSPLLQSLQLEMYETLRCTDIPCIFDITDKQLISLITNDSVLLTSDINVDIHLKQEIASDVKIDDINLIFDTPGNTIPSSYGNIESLFPNTMIFDIHFLPTVFNDQVTNFVKTINDLRGIPSLSHTINVLQAAGIQVMRTPMEQHGITEVVLQDEILFPIIKLNDRLPDHLARAVLVHEIGHLIMHLPILIAQELQSEYDLLKTPNLSARINELYPLLDTEADLIGALLLFPPVLGWFLKTLGTNRTFTTVCASRDGHIMPEEFQIFFHMYQIISGTDMISWDVTYDLCELFDRFWNQNHLLTVTENESFINQLLIRYTNRILQAHTCSPYFAKRDIRIQQLIHDSFRIIRLYLLLID